MDLVESQMLRTVTMAGGTVLVPSVSLWARSVDMSAGRNSKACSGSKRA